MNEENTKFLVETYQPLYEHRQYFACGDGWFNILKELSDAINCIIKETECSCRCYDVKEKYGTLRFCMDTSTNTIDTLIAMAEKISAETCESCGAPRILREKGWIATLCDECAKPKKVNLEPVRTHVDL